jgi:hypothetical protein
MKRYDPYKDSGIILNQLRFCRLAAHNFREVDGGRGELPESALSRRQNLSWHGIMDWGDSGASG